MYSLCCIHLISESVCTSGTTKTLKVRSRLGLILEKNMLPWPRGVTNLWNFGLIIGFDLAPSIWMTSESDMLL